jgi:hypothetical protein
MSGLFDDYLTRFLQLGQTSLRLIRVRRVRSCGPTYTSRHSLRLNGDRCGLRTRRRFDGRNRIFGAKNEPLAMARVKLIGQLASEIS